MRCMCIDKFHQNDKMRSDMQTINMTPVKCQKPVSYVFRLY
jgi:hypothetical protein